MPRGSPELEDPPCVEPEPDAEVEVPPSVELDPVPELPEFPVEAPVLEAIEVELEIVEALEGAEVPDADDALPVVEPVPERVPVVPVEVPSVLPALVTVLPAEAEALAEVVLPEVDAGLPPPHATIPTASTFGTANRLPPRGPIRE